MNKDINFYSITEQETLRHLETSPSGLPKDESLHRLTLYGPNEIQDKRKLI